MALPARGQQVGVAGLDPQAAQLTIEQDAGSAIERFGGEDVIAGPDAGEDRRNHGAHAAAGHQARLGALEVAYALLHPAVVGVVAVARVEDLALAGWIAEEGGGLIDRIDDGLSHHARRISGVHRARGEPQVARVLVASGAHRSRARVESSQIFSSGSESATLCCRSLVRVGATTIS